MVVTAHDKLKTSVLSYNFTLVLGNLHKLKPASVKNGVVVTRWMTVMTQMTVTRMITLWRKTTVMREMTVTLYMQKGQEVGRDAYTHLFVVTGQFSQAENQ